MVEKREETAEERAERYRSIGFNRPSGSRSQMTDRQASKLNDEARKSAEKRGIIN